MAEQGSLRLFGFEIKRAGVFDTGQLDEVLVISPEDYPEFFTWYFKDGK